VNRTGLVPVVVTDPADPRLADYVALTDVALRRRKEPAEGLFVAESEKVIRRAAAAGYPLRSALLEERWLPALADLLERAGCPVYVAGPDVLEAVTGFAVHRGALAAMARTPLPPVAELLRAGGTEPRRVAVLEDVVDHTNLGAAFRSAAALGVDAVLVTPRCADPLYRRSVRVSMGAVFQVPWTRVAPWPAAIETLRAAGYTTVALTPDAGAADLADLAARREPRLALVLGTEGDGLRPDTVAAADLSVRIPMAGGVDSLNVAAAAAVAFYATRLA
jgi:tRNA G18 (ribose-2'-O)-methylase SpoU